MTDIWKNKIVGHAEVAPGDLLANDFNFRRHDERQSQCLEASLNSLGWLGPVLVNQHTGHIVDGHLRVDLAIKREQPTIPVVYLDLTEDEEKRALATYDRIGSLAIEDPDALSRLLDELDLSDNDSLAEMIKGMKIELEVPDIEFKEFDESIEDDVEFNECPNCGHKWPK